MAVGVWADAYCTDLVHGTRVIMHGVSGGGALAAGLVPWTALTQQTVYGEFDGDVQGCLVFPFADPDTLQGLLQPADLKTMQVGATMAGTALFQYALVAVEIYPY